VAPWAGLEPATYWLQAPRDFSRAWTISSPVPPRMGERGCRALPPFRARGTVRSTSLRSSLCTFPAAGPAGGLAQDRPLRDREGRVSLSSPDSSTTISRGSCKPYSQPLCLLSYQGAVGDKIARMGMKFKTRPRPGRRPPMIGFRRGMPPLFRI